MTQNITQTSIDKSFNIDIKSKIEKKNTKIINLTLIAIAFIHLMIEALFRTSNGGIAVIIQFFVSRAIVIHCSDLTKKKGLMTQSILVSIIVFIIRVLLGVLFNEIFMMK